MMIQVSLKKKITRNWLDKKEKSLRIVRAKINLMAKKIKRRKILVIVKQKIVMMKVVKKK